MLNGERGKPKVALVVGSGAVKCAAALGLWKVLDHQGIDLDMLVGCSGGSLFTALMALGWDADQAIEKTRLLWNRKLTEKRNLPSLLSAILPGIFKFDEHFGMIDDRAMLEGLKAVFGEKTFADTLLPFYVVATDFHHGEQVTLSQGKLVDALRASVSIPYIWEPWPIGDRLYVDGSLSNPMPVDVAIKEGADVILAMGFESPYPSRVKSISRFAFHINSIMTNNLFKANFAFHNLAHHAEIIHILPEFEERVRLFDTQKIPYVIQQGEIAMQKQIPYLERLMAASLI
jgi:NTE family protein